MTRATIIKFPSRVVPAVQQPQPARVLILPIVRVERHDDDIEKTWALIREAMAEDGRS